MTPIRTDADRLALKAQIQEKIREVRTKHKIKAPDFPSGLDWLNTPHPLRLGDLRGKVVLLDFWTFCCINCQHVVPDLKYLEKKYANQPFVVIGVHSAKFTHEKETASIRQAVQRWAVEHPVVADSDFAIWQAYTVRAWPTLILIDPEGYLLGVFSGEGNREIIEHYVAEALAIFAQEGKLDQTPLPAPPDSPSLPDSYLRFPGKIIADPKHKRLAISDSNHDRVLVCTPEGVVKEIIGAGIAGREDGDFETAHFNRPQGLAFHGEDLIVCDTENHMLRRVDFGARSVTTIAGTGEQGSYVQRGGAGLKVPLNSPWDIFIHGQTGYIAMAGPHQIWTIDLKTHRAEPFAGTGHEARRDGERMQAAFAQPSGITGEIVGGQLTRLFVADSEISSVRQIDVRSERVGTLLGGDLFQYGDHDGTMDNVRLQHPLGVLFHEGRLYLADTFNHKIKVIDPNLRTCKTLVGEGSAGYADGAHPRFSEPAGLAILHGKMYVADTNNHAIRVMDLHSLETATLRLQPQAVHSSERLVSKGTPITKLPQQILSPGAAEIRVKIILPPGASLNEGSPLQVLMNSLNEALVFPAAAMTVAAPGTEITVPVNVQAQAAESAFRLELLYYYCEKNSGLCFMRQAAFEVPVHVAATGLAAVAIVDAPGPETVTA